MKPTLLVCVQRLGKDVITSKYHDDGEIFINQSKYSMLQLPRHDSLTMEVGDFLDLESTFCIV